MKYLAPVVILLALCIVGCPKTMPNGSLPTGSINGCSKEMVYSGPISDIDVDFYSSGHVLSYYNIKITTDKNSAFVYTCVREAIIQAPLDKSKVQIIRYYNQSNTYPTVGIEIKSP